MRKPTGRLNFTKRAIEALAAPEKGRAHFYDTQVRDLGLRVESNGRKSFFWFRKVQGRPTFKSIGMFPATSVEQARGKAHEYSGELDKLKRNDFQGVNPFERPRGEPTLSELVDIYCDRHLRAHAKRPEHAEKRVREQVEFYLRDWKSRKLSAIRRADVLKLHAELGEKHRYTANRVIQLVRLLYNFALSAELWKGDNPATRIKRFAEPVRKRFLSHEELPRLSAALSTEPSRDLRDFVVLSLFSGCRKADVFSARWENISFDDRRWLIPDPKRDPYAVPITIEAEEILRERLKTRVDGNPWIFPSADSKSGHVEDLKTRWRALLDRAKIQNLRIHDLRRTQGSWSVAQGTSLLIVGKSLGHTSLASTKPYAQLDLDPVRAAMTATNAAMLQAMKRKPKLKAASGVAH